MFSLRSPLIIVCENTWRIQRSYAHENYKKNNASYLLLFPQSRKTMDKQHVFMAFTVSNSVGKMLGKCNVRALGRTIEKRSGKLAVHQRFRGAGKQSTNIMFSLHSPLITLWENSWKMQRSRARENYGKTFRKTSCTLAFSWSRKTIEKHHVFMAFTVSNSVGKMLGKCSVCALGKTMEKRSGKQAIHQRFRGAGKLSTNIMFS